MQFPDGCFPRLNASMLRTNNFQGMIVSMVGKFIVDGSSNNGNNTFLCADQGRILLNADQGAIPDDLPPDMVVEIMGQAVDAETVAIFVTRELSTDTDLDVYNKMLLVQHNPKFQHYFVPPGVHMPSGL